MSGPEDVSAPTSRFFGLDVDRAPDSLAGLAAATGLLLAGAALVSLARWPGWLAGQWGLLWVVPLAPLAVFGRRLAWRAVTLLALGVMTVEIAGQLATVLGWIRVPWWVFGLATTAAAGTGLAAAAVARRLRDEYERAVRQAMRAAYWDRTTGLPSRRVAEIFLEREFGVAQRGKDLTIVLFHLERLDEVGARHGPRFAEQVLAKFGQLLSETTRQMDFVSRFGDEVLALLTGEEPQGAATFAERIRKKASGFQFELEDGSIVESGVVVSGGVASYEKSMEDPSDLVDAARRAVNRAREMGGGRVVVAGREGDVSGGGGS